MTIGTKNYIGSKYTSLSSRLLPLHSFVIQKELTDIIFNNYLRDTTILLFLMKNKKFYNTPKKSLGYL